MSPEEIEAWGVDIARTLTGWNALALYLSVVLGIVGVFLSMVDADGEQLLVGLMFLAPSLYATWLMVEVALHRENDGGAIVRRMGVASMFSSLLVAVAVGVIQAIIVAFPRMRAFIEQTMEHNNGHHYWWQDGIVGQIFLVPMISWILGLLAPLVFAAVGVPIIRAVLRANPPRR